LPRTSSPSLSPPAAPISGFSIIFRVIWSKLVGLFSASRG
jgi:hypothetical protein